MTEDSTTLLTRLLDWSRRILLGGTTEIDDDFAALERTLGERRQTDRDIGDEAIMLSRALRHAARERLYPLGDARPWSMVAGCLVPLNQAALGRAVERRRNALHSEPDDGFRRAR